MHVFGRVQAPALICFAHPPRQPTPRRPSARNCKPAIKTNDTSPRPQMGPERALGTSPRCTTPALDHPSASATTSITQPAHQLTFRHDAPHAPSAPSWTPRSPQPTSVACIARRRAPVLVNPRGRRPERAWVAVTTTALPTRDSPQYRPQRPLTGGHDKKGGQHDSRGHHRPWVENLTEQAQRVARPREHRVTCSREEKEMSRDTVFDRSQPARANQGPCAHLPRLAGPWHGGRVGREARNGVRSSCVWRERQ